MALTGLLVTVICLPVVQIIDLLGGQLVPVGVEELAHAGIGLAGDGVVGIEQDIGPFAHRAVAVAGAADGSGVAHLLAHLHRARLVLDDRVSMGVSLLTNVASNRLS